MTGVETAPSGLPLPCHKFAADRGGFDRQPIAKNHKNKPLFQIFALSNTLPCIFWFEGQKYTRQRCENHTQVLWEPVWDTPDGVAVKQLLFWALTLTVLPWAVILLLNTLLSPHKGWGWHLHVRAYRCNQTVPPRTRIPWPWRSLLVCWWPGTFKNTSRFKKIHN